MLGPHKAQLLELQHKIRFYHRRAPISAEWLSMELGLPILPMCESGLAPGFKILLAFFHLFSRQQIYMDTAVLQALGWVLSPGDAKMKDGPPSQISV